MEPAAERREHGSEDSGHLTCADRLSHERSVKARRWACSMDLSSAKMPADLHASAPRLLSYHLSARSPDDDRAGRAQFLMVTEEQEAVESPA